MEINSDMSDLQEDGMKKMYKFYKRKNPPPEMADVIDFDAPCSRYKPDIQSYPLRCSDPTSSFAEFGLKSVEEWKGYSLSSHPGLVLIRNPFSAAGQLLWSRRALYEWPRPPHRTNLHSSATPSTHGDTGDVNVKLRWVTMGYHHNWDTKVYDVGDRSPVPGSLADMTSLVARCAGWSQFGAEAVIVNYYPQHSTLGPHRDHSEHDLKAPLFSFSFGQSAVFLLGGADRSDVPVAMLIRSGDVIIMSGQSRLSYHAVPRIIQSDCDHCRWRPCSAESVMRDVTDDEVISYLTSSRVNINVRQVFPTGSVT